METVKIALLGLGTVGTGAYKVLKAQQEEIPHKIGVKIQLKKVLVRNTEKASRKLDDPSILTTEWKSILEDPEISIVVEVMGGIEPARSYILDALHAGKSVVTANKDLLASHGKEQSAAIRIPPFGAVFLRGDGRLPGKKKEAKELEHP